MKTRSSRVTAASSATATRVVVAVRPDMFASALERLLQRETSAEVTLERSNDPVELLFAVTESAAQVVILSWAGFPEIPAICSQLFAQFPRLLVVGLAEGGERACLLRAGAEPVWLEAISPSSLVEAIEAGAESSLDRSPAWASPDRWVVMFPKCGPKGGRVIRGCC